MAMIKSKTIKANSDAFDTAFETWMLEVEALKYSTFDILFITHFPNVHFIIYSYE